MTKSLNAFEILTVAVTIERDTIDFYRKAAKLFNDKELRKVLILLADWEQKHESVFTAMKQELSHIREEAMTFDVNGFVSTSPLVLKSLAWSATQSQSKREFTGDESKEEILELAMNRERSTIRFYFELVGVVGDSSSKNKIHAIIEEEKRHVGILRGALEQLSDTQSAYSS
jgi:rubrerythrin